ncbi:MAG TPA: tripartite tricarboxylate transporter substrate-binding protein [Candidatus Limnocylindria bacterium]|nr:tripartite tricarboxylate transporter substrate-binding protein [Candidatus Limnocylindria bacterium]
MKMPTRSIAVAATTLLLIAACGGGGTGAPATGAGSPDAARPASDYPTKPIDLMAPANPGGGFDLTARTIQKALTDDKIVSVNVTVSNKPGAGGTVGMADLIKNSAGDPYRTIVVGRVTVGSQITGKTEAKVSQLIPIARLMGEAEIIVAPASSPFNSLKDVMDALKKDAKAVKIAGGSAGGIDHELAALLVKEAGRDVKDLAYVPFAGGGEAAAAIIGNQVQLGISSFSEFKGQIDSKQMKAIAVSSDAKLKGSNIPTMKEQGTNITVVNWRLWAAPPGTKDADVAALKAIAKKLYESKTWKDAIEKNLWFDNFTTDNLITYVATETQTLTATLTALGLVK